MPRVIIGSEARSDEEIRKLIRLYQGRENTNADLAKICGVAVGTIANRLGKAEKGDDRCHGAGSFNVRELRRLQKGLGIPAREMAEAMFGRIE